MPDPRDDEPRPRLARRPRARYAPEDADQRISRPLLIALIGVVVVAAILFWPRGGGLRLDRGDDLHVVRVDTTLAAPRSGDVDLTHARRPLVPEKPSRVRDTDRDLPLNLTTRVPAAPAARDTTPRAAGASPPAGEAAPAAAPPARPGPDGTYALQVGSSGEESVALALRDDLAGRGYPVHVRAASTASGAITYRVWVGFFATREAAAAFAASRPDDLGGAVPVHR